MATSVLSAVQLLDMSRQELDELFKASPPGPIPMGDAMGTAIVVPGTPLARIASILGRELGWQGKVFDPATGNLRNKVTPLGLKQIKARVYPGESWFDGEPCIVLDYSATSFVARFVRDEIREVAPSLYLGLVFVRRKKTIHFALDFNPASKRQTFVQRLVRRLRSLVRR